MMFLKIACFPIMWLFGFALVDVEYLRANYENAVVDKSFCKQMIAKLDQAQDPVHLAYLGAFQTMWAKHSFNPITKLNSFTEGKKNIDQAVKLNPNDLEIRFIRLSIQKKAPGFLGYNGNIKEDTKYIKNNQKKVTSEVLRKRINVLLK